MAKVHNISNWAEFAATTEESQVRVSKLFAYCYGNEDPSTKKSWCPDCVLAEPVIKEALKSAPADSEVLRVAVGAREAWKDPNNVYREKLGLKRIPTILKLVGGKETGRLEELDCAAKDKVMQFLQS